MSERDTKERTEEPTQHRWEEARRQGNVPRSRDLTIASGLMALGLALFWVGPTSASGLIELTHEGLARASYGARSFSLEAVSSHFSELLGRGMIALAPLTLACFFATLTMGLWQGGGVVRWAALGPDWTRLNPVKKLSGLFRVRQLARVVSGLAKALLVGWLLWRSAAVILAPTDLAVSRGATLVLTAWGAVAAECSRFCFYTAAAFLGLAVLDHGLERWLHRRDLLMSREEVMQEIQEIDGNPETKRQRRRLRQDWLNAGVQGREARRG